jgi:hypothetical protein
VALVASCTTLPNYQKGRSELFWGVQADVGGALFFGLAPAVEVGSWNPVYWGDGDGWPDGLSGLARLRVMNAGALSYAAIDGLESGLGFGLASRYYLPGFGFFFASGFIGAQLEGLTMITEESDYRYHEWYVVPTLEVGDRLYLGGPLGGRLWYLGFGVWGGVAINVSSTETNKATGIAAPCRDCSRAWGIAGVTLEVGWMGP